MFIPLYRDNQHDALIWNDKKNDMYTIRSGYNLPMRMLLKEYMCCMPFKEERCHFREIEIVCGEN